MKTIATLIAVGAIALLSSPALAAKIPTASAVSAPPDTTSSASAAPAESSSSLELPPLPNPPPTPAPAPAASSAEPAPAAADGLIHASDPQTVLDALSALGYRGKLDKMDSGRPSILVRISGLQTYIDFYDCNDDMTGCQTLLLNVSITIKGGTTQDEANKWNSGQIFGRMWLDDDKNPVLDLALPSFDGMPATEFANYLDLWDRAIGNFKDFVKF